MRLPVLLLACLALFVLGLPDRPALAQVLQPGAAAEAAAEAAPALPAESARTLIETIEDPDSRQALIDLLRQAAEAGDPAGETVAEEATEAAVATSEASEDGVSSTERVADGLTATTQAVAEGASRVARQMVGSFRGLVGVATGEIAVDWQKFADAAQRLAVVAAITFLAFYIVRLVARRMFSVVARATAGRTFLGTLVGLLVSALIDEAAVVFAWATGYAFALFTGETAFININQSLFLNAFLMVETIKVVMRMILCPNFGELRLVPLGDRVAGRLYFWAARLVGFVGYGFLLFVPIVNLNVSFFAGRGLRVLIALVAAATVVTLVLRHRRRGAAAINRFGSRLGGFGRSAAAVIARLWHVLAVLYVVVFFTIWLSRPGDALSFMIAATIQSVVAVVVAAIVMHVIARLTTGGIRLTTDMKARLPLLEDRLNRLVPTILKVVRIVLVVLVFLAVLDAWQIVDIVAMASDEAGSEFVAGLSAAAVIALVAVAIWLAMSSWVDFRLNPDFGKVPTARERTLLSLFKNAATIAIVLFASMIALSEIGVDIGPLLAGAGVLGLAIGFGAQKLVQDIITGVFIQFENAVNEGDVVTLGGISGVVEKLTVRSVSLRDLDGVYHLIPFSSVDSVSNYMRGFGYHRAEIGVAYRENITDVKHHMGVAFDRLLATEHGPKILEPLEMHGVTALGDSAVVVRARIKTRPGDQWAVGRAYNEIIKEVFDEAGIEIPFPHMTLWWGEDKAGKAPPLRVARTAAPAGPAQEAQDAPDEESGTVPS